MFEAFLTVLVVANVLPILPVVLEFTADHGPRTRRRLLMEAIVVGNAVAVGAALSGGFLLAMTRLTLDDLRVAGGIVLLVFSVYDLLFNREQRKRPTADEVEDDAAGRLVPLAVPMLVGPATLATVVVVAEDQGLVAAVMAIAANALINAALLAAAEPIHRRIGGGLARASGKVMSLILATLAVSMIRAGVEGMASTGARFP